MSSRAYHLVKIVIGTFCIVAVWTGLVIIAGLSGFGRWSLPDSSSAAFMTAAKEATAEHQGNVALVLLDEGRVVDEHYASIGRPVDRDTLFQVASVSKWITAWGVMTLVESGRVDLDAPVETYLTRWRLPDSEFDHRAVTVRRLLSHTAGFTDGLGYCGFAPGQQMQTLEASLTRASDACPGAAGEAKVGAEPGSAWRYSGGGYTLLQLVIEEVTEEPFAVYMRSAVLAPLGMNRSTFDPLAADAANLAAFYDTDGSEATHFRYTASGAASLYTSAADLTRFVQAHLPGPNGEPIGRGVLTPRAVASMRAPHGSQFGVGVWGLGLRLYTPTEAGRVIVGHDGGNAPAVNATARLDTDTGDAIIALSTGGDWLASRMSSEWLFLRRGDANILTAIGEAQRLFAWIVGGSILILLGGMAVAFRAWRRKPV